jgi:hypothetical protein
MSERRKAFHRQAQLPFGGALMMAILATTAAGCGIGVKRDFATIPSQTVIFDDMCGLQDYFDALLSSKATAPQIVSSTDFQKADALRAAGGRTTFSFETDFQLKTLRRLLEQNWSSVPEEVMKADKVLMEVRWAEKAGIKRVVTEEVAEIQLGRKVIDLPYQTCLSEFLFGEPLYVTRREILGLPPLSGAPPAAASESQTVFATPQAPAPAPAPAAAPPPAAPNP